MKSTRHQFLSFHGSKVWLNGYDKVIGQFFLIIPSLLLIVPRFVFNSSAISCELRLIFYSVTIECNQNKLNFRIIFGSET